MIRVLSDVGKNRIVVELVGRPTSDQIAQAERDLAEGLRRLRPPIDVMSDVSQLDSLDGITSAEFERLGTMLMNTGVRRVVRVVGRSKEGALHMQRMARFFKHSAHLAFSREEAETVLAQR